jgi:hypothetical protein
MKTIQRLLGLLPLALAFGCNLIAGIEEAKLDPSLDNPGSTGSGGTGGSGTLPAGITPVDGGCATDPGIDEGLIVGCLMRVSCDPWNSYYTASQCVTFGAQTFGGAEFCTFRADSCEDVEGCLGRAYAEPGDCTGRPEGWSCEGNEAYLCGYDPEVRLDCEALGASCGPGPGSFAGQMGPCVVNDYDCTGVSDGSFFCDGEVLYVCEGGAAYSQDCSAQGYTCIEPEPGAGFCSSRTTTCTDAGTITCEGDRINLCDATGYFQSYDCATAGLSCEQDGTSVAYCLAEGCTKDDACYEECVDDTTLSLCQGGSPVEVDCTAYGFESCTEVDYGDGVLGARCLGGNGSTGGGAPPRDDSCEYALDSVCDEPLYCAAGTDETDCAAARGTCDWESDGSCDVPSLCAPGSDLLDCLDVDLTTQCCSASDPCQLTGLGVCVCPSESWNAADCGG